MPRISFFFGISIYMYFSDHEPPHFHARYADGRARVNIADGSVVDSTLPRRAEGLVVEWATLHRAELLENWQRVQKHEAPEQVAPLE